MEPEEGDEADRNQVVNQAVIDMLTGSRILFRQFLRRHVSDEALADDLLQQATLNALRHERDWEAKDSIVAWFYRILRNVLIDHYRFRSSEGRKSEAIAFSLSDRDSDPETEIARLCGCFRDLLPSLKTEYADLIRRIDLDGESQGQVAQELGITANTLSVRLHRARQSLRKNLERTCGLCTKHGCLDCTCGLA